MEDHLQVKGRHFWMVGHALWFDKFSNHFNEYDGWYPVTIHQYFCSGVFGWHSHLQQDLGITLVAYSTYSSHPTATQAICQHGKILLRHGQGLVPRLHCWFAWCACWSSQDPSHHWLANPNQDYWASELIMPCQFLSQVHVGILPNCMGPQLSNQGWW